MSRELKRAVGERAGQYEGLGLPVSRSPCRSVARSVCRACRGLRSETPRARTCSRHTPVNGASLRAVDPRLLGLARDSDGLGDRRIEPRLDTSETLPRHFLGDGRVEPRLKEEGGGGERGEWWPVSSTSRLRWTPVRLVYQTVCPSEREREREGDRDRDRDREREREREREGERERDVLLRISLDP